jgi:hypothetical protein
MRFPRSFIGLIMIAMFGALSAPALAFHGHGQTVETVSVAPVETVWTVPTSYVATSYVLPTSYVASTVSATSYLLPTYSLSPTAYVVPTYYRAARLLRRAYYVPTTYTYWSPTAYYLTPTVYEGSYVPTALVSSALDCVCDSAPAVVAPSAASPAKTPAGVRENRPSAEISSQPAAEPELKQGAPQGGAVSPPPSPPPNQGGTPNPPNAPATTTPGTEIPETPPMPAPEPGTEPRSTAPPSQTTQSSSFKPALSDAGLRHATTGLTILEGRVIAADSRQPEAGVRVFVSDHRQRYDDRVATTDALGRYAINLPDGDWTVRVESASGRRYVVGDLTVSNGRIVFSDGREVPSLVIKR